MNKPKQETKPEKKKKTGEPEVDSNQTEPPETAECGEKDTDAQTQPQPDTDAADELSKLKEELKSKCDAYLRLAAEYDNYRRRTQNEKLHIYSDATAKAVEELLPLSDSVTAALNLPSGGNADHTKGIELIANQLAKCFEKLKVEPFGQRGDVFDPAIHNAVAKTEDPEVEQNCIAQVFQQGFKMGDKVIRPAMVQVANCQ